MRRHSRAATWHIAALVYLFELGLTACAEKDRTKTPRGDTIPPAAVAPRPAAPERGLRFDPAALRAGTPVGELVIESFTIHRGHSDQVNTARFVRRLTRCYRSAHSVLFGPPTRSGQQGRGPGWLRLEGPAAAHNGQGELVDADRKGLGASWRREPNDSMSVVAMHDHLRVELQLVVSDSVAVGPARAHSDATAERDAAGRLRDLRRAWVLRAVKASCDSMPVPWR